MRHIDALFCQTDGQTANRPAIEGSRSMSTRTIAIAALVIAVILLLYFLI